jgi:acyl carrier protein
MVRTHDEVLAELTRIFREVLNNNSIILKNETTAADIPDWDSLTHIELVVAIEKNFSIRFNFVELQKFKNVGEWCDNIVAKLAGGK